MRFVTKPTRTGRRRKRAADFDLSKGLERTDFDTTRLVSEKSAEVYHDRRLDDFAVRINWDVGDVTAGAYRIELADSFHPNEGEPVFYTFSFLVPDGLALDDQGFVTIGQFHTIDAAHKPLIAFRVRASGDLDVTLNHLLPAAPGESEQSLQLKPLRIAGLKKGRWHRFDLSVVWSCGDDGMIDMVFNGRHVLRFAGQNSFDDQKGLGPFFKFGVYPSAGNSAPLTVSFARYDCVTDPPAGLLAQRGFETAPHILKERTYDKGGRRIVIVDE